MEGRNWYSVVQTRRTLPGFPRGFERFVVNVIDAFILASVTPTVNETRPIVSPRVVKRFKRNVIRNAVGTRWRVSN